MWVESIKTNLEIIIKNNIKNMFIVYIIKLCIQKLKKKQF